MPQQATYYHIKVSTVFFADNEMFYPSHDYWVSPETYDSQLSDGRKFKDLCLTAQQETHSFGGGA
jgi:hypothetical protein